MSEVYEKENKAPRKQQIAMQLTFLDECLRKNALEKMDILADIIKLKEELTSLLNQGRV